jgi:hypothetical protein
MNEKELRDQELELELKKKFVITKKRRLKWFIGSFFSGITFAFVFSSVYNQNISIPHLLFLIPFSIISSIPIAWVGPHFWNHIILARAAIIYKKENKGNV